MHSYLVGIDSLSLALAFQIRPYYVADMKALVSEPNSHELACRANTRFIIIGPRHVISNNVAF